MQDSGERFAYAGEKADTADKMKLAMAEQMLMPDGSRFVYEDIKNNAEPTGSDIASKTGKGPDISSASKNNISQKSQNSNTSDKNSSKDFDSGERSALADELISNEKDTSGMTEDIKEMKRHIREITFEVRERDKGEFDSVGGYERH